VIMGHPNLEVTEGQIYFKGQDITDADPDERARMGLFMAFQYPVAVPGVTVTKYLRTALNAHRQGRGEEPIPLKDFRQTVEAAMKLTDVPREFSSRYLNEGFSGGEKKRMEILQLALMRPEMAILDETDSGLDIDALRVVANGVNSVAGPDMGVLIITHYQRILHLVQPSDVHVMYQGRIVKTGGQELVDEHEATGYGWSTDELLAMHIWEINTIDEQTIRHEMLSAARQSRMYFVFQHRMKSGELRDVEVHSGPVEVGAVEERLAHADEALPDARLGLARGGAGVAVVHRHVAPGQHGQPHSRERALYQALRALDVIAREKQHAEAIGVVATRRVTVEERGEGGHM